MPTIKNRVTTVLNSEDYAMLTSLSKREQLSLSEELRLAIRDRIERADDRRLYEISARRFQQYLKKGGIPFEQIHGKRKV